MKLKLETIEPKLRERIERQMRQEDAGKRTWLVQQPESPKETKPKRIRQKEGDGMNKLEREFEGILNSRYITSKTSYVHTIYAQCIRLKIANGCTLTPDFAVFFADHAPHFYEVKGPFAWEDSLIKLKVAAYAYPKCTFILAWKKDGAWKEQEVLP